ncbi:hypothetical protein TWF718_000403 [Orbilia javanica]|uniref:Uncharacterized protein n=1 Tax=Orbilia javanica TaxID=47235 RepID=A0AAN8NFA7_9PEZI
MPQSACFAALGYFQTNEVFWTEKRAWYTYDGFGYSCLARYSCGNVQDYVSAAQAGVSRGYNLVTKARTIYKSDGGRYQPTGHGSIYGKGYRKPMLGTHTQSVAASGKLQPQVTLASQLLYL